MIFIKFNQSITGIPLPEPSFISLIIVVPVAVPSLFHGSLPCTPSSALKNSSPFISTILPGYELSRTCEVGQKPIVVEPNGAAYPLLYEVLSIMIEGDHYMYIPISINLFTISTTGQYRHHMLYLLW